jgi:membrane protein
VASRRGAQTTQQSRPTDPYPQEGQGRPSDVPGADAHKPTDIPADGWKQILLRTKEQVKEDNVPLLAAGVAFYAFIALFPALIAAVTLYGLVADPAQVEEQIASLTDTLPDDAASLIGAQLRDIATTSSSSLGWGLLVSLGGALFAASGGVQNLIKAVNIAYDEEETRGFLKLRGLALLLTLVAVVFVVVAVGLIAVLPVVLNAAGVGGIAWFGVQVARWVGLVAFVALALAIVYRYAPDRDNPKFRWVGLGSAVATVLWIVGSAAFSLYVSRFGSYDKTYGALAGVIVLLLWLWLTSLVVLVGAEINSESEMQTAKDTTEGPEKPMGARDAVKADSLPASG